MPRTRLLLSLILSALAALSSLVVLLPGASFAQADDFAAAGLLSETEYVSPQYGYEITWDSAWGVDASRVDPVLWSGPDIDRDQDIPVLSNAYGAEDRLDLWNAELDARLRIIGVANSFSEGYVGVLSVPSVIYTLGGKAQRLVELDGEDRSVIVDRHARNDGTILLVYNEAIPLDGGAAWNWVELVAPEDGFEDAYAAAIAGVQSDAFEMGGFLDVDEMMDAAAAEPVVPVSELGITSATSWTSPSHDVEITWIDRFTTFENLEGANGEFGNRLTVGAALGPYVPIKTGVFDNDEGYETIDDLFADTLYAYEAQEKEILIAGIEGDRAIFLCRSVSNDPVSIYYIEYGLSADGEAITWAEMQGPMTDEDFAFSTRFALVVGAISIEGIPFADTYDPAVVIAAANAPIDER